MSAPGRWPGTPPGPLLRREAEVGRGAGRETELPKAPVLVSRRAGEGTKVSDL